MGITYKDVAMVGDGIDSLTGAVLKRKALQREKKRDEADDAYRNRALDANAKESERNAAARSEEAASRKAYYDTQNAQGAERNVLLSAEQQAKARVAEKASQHARMQGTLDWLKDGVTKGVIPPDKANQALKQALSKVPPEELEGTPFASIDESFFQAPKADDGKMDFVEDPVTGERFARRGNQTLKSGVNPSKQQQISEEQRRAKLAIDAEEERQAKLASEAASIESRAKPIRDKIQSGNRYVGPEFMGLGDRQKDLDPLEAELARKRVEMAAQGQPAPSESPTVPTTIPTTQEPAQAQTGAMHGVAKPTSREEVMRLPKGVRFLNPADGKVYIKK
jgi:hypothetical protein